MRLIVAVTGASGAILAAKLLEQLTEHETHLIVSDAARAVLRHELGHEDLPAAFGYGEDDWGSPLASSSFLADGMVIVPCSMKTLAMVAHGLNSNLIGRAADNVLRMGRRLVLVPRETPLSLAAIENMRLAKMAGAIVLPPNMAFYFGPQTLDDMVGFVVGKILDVLGLPHALYRRWEGPATLEDET
ncbi:MAG: UbiX family flavin prenyltransferase [Anaerolineae bacterium]|nr:UbiX family flavin prenyltransferase [Anaerolineae bacterium]